MNLTPVQERILFQDSLAFKKLANISQVLSTVDSAVHEDIYRNRLTHSIEVAEFIRVIAINNGIPKNKVEEMVNAGLGHDLGHPPFGHEGAEILNECSKKYGIKEGFKDNSNNFSIIFNNNIQLSEYTILSMIKYPEELYEDQKFLLKNLEEVCAIEAGEYPIHKQTIGCRFMDIADTVSYGVSDIVDSYTTGYTVEYFEDFIDECLSILKDNTFMKQLFEKIKKDINSKRVIRENFAIVKLLLIENIKLDKNVVDFENETYKQLLKIMLDFSYKYFIKNPIIRKSRNIKNKKFKKVCEVLFENPNLILSTLYKNKYNKRRKTENKLKIIRDCIGDMTDEYVLKLYKDFKKLGVI